MAKKKAELETELREKYLALLIESCTQAGEEVLRVENGAIAFPVVDSEGNERYLKIQVSIPLGQRVNGTIVPYDAYLEAEAYAVEVREAEEKAKAKEAKRAKNIAKDEARRKAQAEVAEASAQAKARLHGENEGE
jgi:hypothetical protein